MVKSCQRLYDRDNRVFAVKRNLTQKNADKKEELEAYLDHISFINMDLSDISVKKAMDRIMAEAENIRVLINNA